MRPELDNSFSGFRGEEGDSSPSESLSLKNSFSNMSLKDIAKLNFSGPDLQWEGGFPPVFFPKEDPNVRTIMMPGDYLNPASNSGGENLQEFIEEFNKTRLFSGNPEGAVDNFLRKRFSEPSIDPGYDKDPLENKPVSKMLQTRFHNASRDLDVKEQKIFDDAFGKLSKADQAAVREEFRSKENDVRLHILWDRPVGMSPAVKKFREELVEKFKPIEEERTKREEAIEKQLSSHDRDRLQWERAIPI